MAFIEKISQMPDLVIFQEFKDAKLLFESN